jgi:hypothetical protein
VRMTKELLAGLGSCGDYVRTFRRLFPIEQYPDGIEINEEVCLEQANQFPWDWAVEQMLTYDGAEEFRKVRNELRAEVRALENEQLTKREAWKTQFDQRYNEPDWDTSSEARDAYNALINEYNTRLTELGLTQNQRSARAFGRVFDTMPEFRAPRVESARENAVRQIEATTITRYDSLTQRLESNRAELERLTELVPQLEAEEAELRVKYVPAKARQRAAEAAMLADRAAEATRLAEAAQTRADDAKAEADKLAAEAEAIGNASIETTTDDTATDTHESETPSSSS